MAVVGRVLELWRYPVKSMGGESLKSGQLGGGGVHGDRGWALRDEQAGEIRGAKKLPDLLRCTARYLSEPTETTVPPAEITLPDGACMRSDDSGTALRLSELLGRRTPAPRNKVTRVAVTAARGSAGPSGTVRKTSRQRPGA